MIQAVLFDLDGVLIETEHETFKFYQNYLAEHYGIELTDDDFKYKAGRKSVDFWNAVLTPKQRLLVDTKKITALKRNLFGAQPQNFIKKVPGGGELLIALKHEKFKIALASQNEIAMINAAIDWLNVRQYFEVLLSIDDVERLKPDPEIYLLAARKLGIKPEACVVIEDSQDGIGAAKNAGMLCIAIKHPYTPPGDTARADIAVRALNEITAAMIHSL